MSHDLSPSKEILLKYIDKKVCVDCIVGGKEFDVYGFLVNVNKKYIDLGRGVRLYFDDPENGHHIKDISLKKEFTNIYSDRDAKNT